MSADHACAGCGAPHGGAKMVQLIDGRVASSFSEAWRHECEARSILKFTEHWKRNTQLERVENIRGKAAADKLRATVRQLEAMTDQPERVLI